MFLTRLGEFRAHIWWQSTHTSNGATAHIPGRNKESEQLEERAGGALQATSDCATVRYQVQMLQVLPSFKLGKMSRAEFP